MQKALPYGFSTDSAKFTEPCSKFASSLSSVPRVLNSYYDSVPWPVRSLFSIPVRFAQIIQRNTIPTILFTEGYHVFRQNFGVELNKFFPMALAGGLVALQSSNILLNLAIGGLVIAMSSIDKRLQNNLLLYGIAICTFAKVYINPSFDEKHEGIMGVWHKVDNTTIPDIEFFPSFFDAVWNFTVALAKLLLNDAIIKALSSDLKGNIVHQRQLEFLKEWPLAILGRNIRNKLGKEGDNEKANLNSVQLCNSDIENQNLLLPLWISRVNTIVDCALVCYTLFTDSPELVLPLYFTTIILPRFLVMSIGYSFIFNALLSFFEAPAQKLHRKLNQLKDVTIRQITNIDHYARSIILLKGMDFEIKKLLSFLIQERRLAKIHDILDSIKEFIMEFIKEFQFLFPLLTSVFDIRNGKMRPEEVSPYISFFSRINIALTWVKANFEKLDEIAQSIQRLTSFRECCQEGAAKLSKIEEKRVHSDVIGFTGSYYADDDCKILLGWTNAGIVFEPGSRILFDVKSGGGKSTFFDVLDGSHNFDGKCTLPIDKSIFYPSEVYIPGPDEPLFQMICYPEKYGSHTDRLELVGGWFKSLNLPDHILENLNELPSNNEQAYLNFIAQLASDGEGKRLAFCNILLKLVTREIKFLCMDEFLKGVDAPTQKIMSNLLIEVIAQSNKECVLLYSNHENNHGLNTHRLYIDETTKELKIVPVFDHSETLSILS